MSLLPTIGQTPRARNARIRAGLPDTPGLSAHARLTALFGARVQGEYSAHDLTDPETATTSTVLVSGAPLTAASVLRDISGHGRHMYPDGVRISLSGGTEGPQDAVTSLTIGGTELLTQPVERASTTTITATNLATEINLSSPVSGYSAQSVGALVWIYRTHAAGGTFGLAVVPTTIGALVATVLLPDPPFALMEKGTYALGSLNGGTCLHLQSMRSEIRTDSFTPIVSPLTIFLVVWNTIITANGAGQWHWFNIPLVGSASTLRLRGADSKGEPNLRAGVDPPLAYYLASTAPEQDGFTVYTCHFDGANSSVFVNGIAAPYVGLQSTLDAIPGLSLDMLSLFGLQGTSTRERVFKHAAFVTGLSVGERATAAADLMAYYGISDGGYSRASPHLATLAALPGFRAGLDPADASSVTGETSLTAITSFGAGTNPTKSGAGAITRKRVPIYWQDGKHTLRFSGDAALDFALPAPLADWTMIFLAADQLGEAGTLFSADNDTTIFRHDNGTTNRDTTGHFNEKMFFSRGVEIENSRHLSGGFMQAFSIASNGEYREMGSLRHTFTGMGTAPLQNLRIGNNAAGTSPFKGDLLFFALYEGILTKATDLRTAYNLIAEEAGLLRVHRMQPFVESAIFPTISQGFTYTDRIDVTRDHVVHPLDYDEVTFPAQADFTWLITADGVDPGGYDAVYSRLDDALVAQTNLPNLNNLKLLWHMNPEGGEIPGSSQTNSTARLIYPAGIMIIPQPGKVGRWVINADPAFTGETTGAIGQFRVGREGIDGGASSIYMRGGLIKGITIGDRPGETVRPAVRLMRAHGMFKDMHVEDVYDGIITGTSLQQFETHILDCDIRNAAHPGGLQHGFYLHNHVNIVKRSRLYCHTQGHHAKFGRGVAHCELEDCVLADLDGLLTWRWPQGDQISLRSQRPLDINLVTNTIIKNVVFQVGQQTTLGGASAPLGGFIAFLRSQTTISNSHPTWSSHFWGTNLTLITHGLVSGANNPGGDFLSNPGSVARMLDVLQRHSGFGGSPNVPFVTLRNSVTGNLLSNPHILTKFVAYSGTREVLITEVNNDAVSTLPIDGPGGNWLFASGAGATGTVADMTWRVPWTVWVGAPWAA